MRATAEEENVVTCPAKGADEDETLERMPKAKELFLSTGSFSSSEDLMVRGYSVSYQPPQHRV